MDSRDEELTLENVDELVEQYLSRPQESQPPTMTSLTHVVQNLQSIYEEERLEHVWARINKSIPVVNSDNAIKQVGELFAKRPAQEEKKALSDAHRQSFNAIQHRPARQSQQIFRGKRWYRLGIGLAAAIVLVTFFTWPMLSNVLRNAPSGNSPTSMKSVTPQAQSTVDASNMKEYVSQYFNIQRPAKWVITSTNMGSQGAHLQKVQFRPSATSSVFVNVDALPTTHSSTEQLLHMDPDAKLGTLVSTKSVTYNRLPWTIGIVELTGAAHVQPGYLEIAYSNPGSPYRIEFGATSSMFNSYMKVFNAMFASFYVQKTGPKVVATVMPTITPTAMPIATPLPTPLPTIANVPGIKVYSSLYFTLQYPANWVITSVTTGGVYQQTVQIRPSATSAVFVNINVMYNSDLSSSLLLLIDPEVKLGTLLSTKSVTYNGLPWTLGIVTLLSAQASEVEIAYSNQHAPYKVELSAPPDMFSSYTQVFNTMLASFAPAN